MKTAMQELIESYERSANQYLEMKQINKASLYFRLARWAKEFYLEKEKDQIIQSYQLGAINNYDKAKWINLTPEYFEICGKEYYIKHYNQNK